MPARTDLADQYEVGDWAPFPGGELEGPRPKALCAACRERLRRQASQGGRTQGDDQRSTRGEPRTICFQCCRAEFARQRALVAAGRLDTASEARFQSTLPFEPIDKPRLERLRVEREDARRETRVGAGRFVERLRHAQIAARHALAGIDGALESRAAIHAAELQLPESWLPFVVAR